MFNKLKKFLKSKRAVGSVATAIKVGTACVLGAAILVGGVALTNDVVLPNTSDKVSNIAAYEGGEAGGGSVGGVEPVYVPASYNHDDPALHPTGTIPEGGTYTVAAVYVQTGMFEWDCELVSDEIVYNAGDEFPQNVTLNDCYQYGDYAYTYSEDYGWMVNIDSTKTDKNQTSYGVILESINGEPITFMGYTFRDFTLLTMSPIIPNGVTDMQYAFEGCTSLTTAPVIPDGVTDMRCTFEGCTSLTGTITVNANPTSFSNCLKNCGDSTHPITLTGSSTKLTQIKNTAGSEHTEYITIS